MLRTIILSAFVFFTVVQHSYAGITATENPTFVDSACIAVASNTATTLSISNKRLASPTFFDLKVQMQKNLSKFFSTRISAINISTGATCVNPLADSTCTVVDYKNPDGTPITVDGIYQYVVYSSLYNYIDGETLDSGKLETLRVEFAGYAANDPTVLNMRKEQAKLPGLKWEKSNIEKTIQDRLKLNQHTNANLAPGMTGIPDSEVMKYPGMVQSSEDLARVNKEIERINKIVNDTQFSLISMISDLRSKLKGLLSEKQNIEKTIQDRLKLNQYTNANLAPGMTAIPDSEVMKYPGMVQSSEDLARVNKEIERINNILASARLFDEIMKEVITSLEMTSGLNNKSIAYVLALLDLASTKIAEKMSADVLFFQKPG